jgi:hypothetical protein
MSSHQSSRNIKTILVAPGQLGTTLFTDVKTPSGFLAPVVEPTELAREIVAMIDRGGSGEIRLPLYAGLVPALSALPASLQWVARRWSGLDKAMLNSKKQKSG